MQIIYKENELYGPRTEPRGTPERTFEIDNEKTIKYTLLSIVQVGANPIIGLVSYSLFIKRAWGTLLNALLQPKTNAST